MTKMSLIRKINFIKANHFTNDGKQTSNQLNGKEIQEFYQNLISTYDPINDQIKDEIRITTNSNCNKSVEKRKSVTNTNINIKEDSIFKYCQNGEKDKCLEWLSMGFDINIKDQYLWTPLMCSSCAGHQDIVDLLLKSGANASAQDRKGRNAIDLALINGHKHVIQLIINHKKHKKSRNKTNVNHKKEVESELKKCDVCGHEFIESDVQHMCSIAHQIRGSTHKSLDNCFPISQRNKGFEMMLRKGWSTSQGLGPLGTGRKFPIKTVLKRDRLGLGCIHTKARVTHFSSFDTKAVNKLSSDAKQTRRTQAIERKKVENKLKRIEIKFRNDFKY